MGATRSKAGGLLPPMRATERAGRRTAKESSLKSEDCVPRSALTQGEHEGGGRYGPAAHDGATWRTRPAGP